jgi:hydrophobic/amphiphilic exporter-1 (mainly G- bacteria), HAE1 family
MNLTKAAINRPIFIFMLMLAAFLLGTLCYTSMRLELNPEVSFGTVTIITSYEGASAQDINELISKKVEDAVSGVSGIREVTSVSQEGTSTVTLTFELGTDLDAAVNDVRSKVDGVTASLPKDADKPVTYKFDTTASPVLNLALSSDRLNSKQLRDLVDDKLQDMYAQVPGVVQVGVTGGDQREIQVRLSKDKLFQYGLGIADVQAALANASLNVPAGHLVSGPIDYTVRVKGEFQTPEQVRDMIITISDPKNPLAKPSIVRLGEIADVADSSVERTSYSRLNGQDTITLNLQKARDGNSVEIEQSAAQVSKAIEDEYKSDGIHILKTYEEAKQITDSLADLRFALAFGIFLVAGIVFLFLHDIRGTIIVALAIPTCIFCSFIGMKMLGFTINNMSMLSLSLAIGVLVDDAIVVLENIYRHLRLGENPRDAALNGRSEIGMAAMAITMADVVVFLPIGFMQGIVGQFFKPLALGFVCAVLFSLFVSFTLTPLLAARWYKAGEDLEHPKGSFAQWFEREFHALENRYRNALEWALRHRWFVFILGNISLVAVLMFIGGSGADNPAGAIQTGMPLLFVALVIGMMVFNRNFRKHIDPTVARVIWGGTLVIGVLLAIIAPVPPPMAAMAPMLHGALMFAIPTLLQFPIAFVWNLVERVSKMRYLASALAFGLLFPVATLSGYAFHSWKQEQVFKFQFIPDTDAGQVSASIQLKPGMSLQESQNVVTVVENKFKSDPDVKYVVSGVGEGSQGGFSASSNGSNYANVSATLYDKEALTDRLPWVHHTEKLRTRSDSEVAADLTEKVGRVPGAQISITTNGSGFGSAIQMSLTSDNHDLLLATATKVRDALANGAVKGVLNPVISTNAGKPELQILPRREELADANLDPATLGNAVRILYQGNDDTKMRGPDGREYGIRVMMDVKDRDDPKVMGQVPVRFVQGNPILLSSVADIVQAPGTDKITRRNRAEEVSINADLSTGFASGSVTQQLEGWLKSANMLPAEVKYHALGQADAQNREGGYILGALLLGLVLVYMLLASLYDNLLYPFIVQLAQPQALVGALLALIITNKSMNIVGIIGVIALIGLVGKNAILVVDYTNTLRDRGRNRHDALVEAGPTRLRPIMMTTLALILGMLPVALAIGRGSEFRETIGITIIGGMTLSTMLTLLVIPCSYTIFDDLAIKIARFRHKPPQHVHEGDPEARVAETVTPL